MTRPATELAEGVWLFQTALWQTNSLLAVAGSEALVCDPCWTPQEIAAIRERAAAAGGPIHLLLTHADYDHTCGIGLFDGASVVAGPETAEAIRSGAAAKALAAAAGEWGLEWPLELRVDVVVEPGEQLRRGAFAVEAIDARGHVADGLAYLLPDQGILLPGDYLSAITIPFVSWSLDAARRTLDRLLEALERDVAWVVPGHGPALRRDEARDIGLADLAYLERLAQEARAAVAARLSPGDALLVAYAVDPPRASTDDFELYGIRTLNARRALAEAA